MSDLLVPPKNPAMGIMSPVLIFGNHCTGFLEIEQKWWKFTNGVLYTNCIGVYTRAFIRQRCFLFLCGLFSFFFTISTLLCNFTCLFARFYSRSLIVCTSESYHLISEPSLISVILKVHFFFFSFFLSFFAFKGFACLFHFKLQLASLCTKSLLSLSRSLAVLLSLSCSRFLAPSL